MNGKTNRNGLDGGWKKVVAGLAMLAGAGLWSGCDQSDEMSAMARRQWIGGALSPYDGLSGAAVEKAAIAEEIKAGSLGDKDRPIRPPSRLDLIDGSDVLK